MYDVLSTRLEQWSQGYFHLFKTKISPPAIISRRFLMWGYHHSRSCPFLSSSAPNLLLPRMQYMGMRQQQEQPGQQQRAPRQTNHFPKSFCRRMDERYLPCFSDAAVCPPGVIALASMFFRGGGIKRGGRKGEKTRKKFSRFQNPKSNPEGEREIRRKRGGAVELESTTNRHDYKLETTMCNFC